MISHNLEFLNKITQPASDEEGTTVQTLRTYLLTQSQLLTDSRKTHGQLEI
jgi:hypothetical protein